MTDTRRTGLRRFWYIASWRVRHWWLDTRGGLAARAVLALAVLVATVGWIWRDVALAPPAGQPLQAVADWVVYAIMFVVSIFISLALAPKPKNAQAQRVEVAQVEDGATLVRIYGPVWIDNPHVIGDKPNGTVPIRKKAGKSWKLKTKWQTVGHWYQRIFHFLLCVGPIDKVMAIRGADKEAWVGELTASGSITVSKPNLWGGEDAEGGIDGVFEFMFGDADQEPNAYLAANLSPKQSAYRSRTSVVFKGGRWGTSPYFKSPSFLVSRILKGWDDDDPWYPEKAAVFLGGSPEIVQGFRDTYWSMTGSSGLDPQVDQFTLTGDGSTTVRVQLGISGVVERRRYSSGEIISPDNPAFIRGGTGSSSTMAAYNVYKLEISSPPQVYYLNNTTASTSSTLVLENELLEVDIASNATITLAADPIDGLQDPPYQWLRAKVLNVEGGGALHGMNVAHALYDSVTARAMDGEPRALVNDESFRAAADRLYEEGVGIGTSFDASKETIEQFQQRLCDLAGGRLSRDPTTGEWHLDLIRDDIGVDDLPVLTDDDLLEFERQPSTLDEAVNQVVVEWFDPFKKENRSTAPLQSLGAIQAFGTVNGEVRTYREVLTEDLALRLADRDLRVKSSAVDRFSATVTRVAYGWRSGKKFRLQAPKHGIADMVCLLGDIDRGTLRSGAMRITFAQVEASMATTTYVAPEVGAAPSLPGSASPASYQRAFETPYAALRDVLEPSELTALSGPSGFVSAVAANPGGALDYVLWARADGGAYAEAAVGEWCPSATVVEACQDSDPEGGRIRTTFTLSDMEGVESVQLGTAALWGDEIVRVDALDSNAGTIELGRGCADTVPQLHAAGERIWFYGDFHVLDPTERQAGQEVDAKILTRMPSGDVLAIGSVTALPVTLNRRQSRPYPPGRVRIEDEVAPQVLEGAFTIAWAHRDRLQQGATLVDESESSIGPESTCRYALRILDGDDEVLVEKVDIAGTSATVDLAYSGDIKIELYSVSDSGESWQRHLFATAYTAGEATESVISADSYTGGIGSNPATEPPVGAGVHLVVQSNTDSIGYSSPQRPLPHGIQNGDGLYAFVNGPGTLETPDGWTLLTSIELGDPLYPGRKFYAFRKDLATIYDPGTEVPWAGFSDAIQLQYVVARSAGGMVKVDQTATEATAYPSKTPFPHAIAVPTVTAEGDGELVVVAVTQSAARAAGMVSSRGNVRLFDPLTGTTTNLVPRVVSGAMRVDEGESIGGNVTASAPIFLYLGGDGAIAGNATTSVPTEGINYYAAIVLRLQPAPWVDPGPIKPPEVIVDGGEVTP